jgi:hypothetical protein
MKYIFTSIALFISVQSIAQNVGIGTETPIEKLDVKGNVNISGTIKANGIAGTNGQVLMSTGTGLSWGSQMNYKKCVMFNTPGSSTWTVPAGVTEVMVELWGGGSGGTAFNGGTSGGYARTVQTVSPGYTISYTVGNGSTWGAATSANGGNTQATLPYGYFSASGGGGIGGSTTRGTVTSGTGYLTEVFYCYGNMGEPTISYFGQKNSTTFVETKKFGAGGQPVGFLNTRPVEGDVVVYENGSAVSANNSQSSRLPGAGGAAGNGSGWAGGIGMVIFWYN